MWGGQRSWRQKGPPCRRVPLNSCIGLAPRHTVPPDSIAVSLWGASSCTWILQKFLYIILATFHKNYWVKYCWNRVTRRDHVSLDSIAASSWGALPSSGHMPKVDLLFFSSGNHWVITFLFIWWLWWQCCMQLIIIMMEDAGSLIRDLKCFSANVSSKKMIRLEDTSVQKKCWLTNPNLK